MNKNDMHTLWQGSFLDGGNASWLEAMYENYLENPASVEPHWQKYFKSLIEQSTGYTVDIAHTPIKNYFIAQANKPLQRCNTASEDPADRAHDRKQVQVLQLINAYRIMGHRAALLNPLPNAEQEDVPELTLEYHNLSTQDYPLMFDTGSLHVTERATLETIHNTIKQTYCHSIGAEYMHITNTEEKRWVQYNLESTLSSPEVCADTKKRILKRLTAAESLEKYLHTKYVGQKRFSLEGAESLIPMLDELVYRATGYDVKETVVGMAHRGRLNVLINIIGKHPADLFNEFEGKKEMGAYSGDVKYHMGYSSDIRSNGNTMHLTLSFNPSHLEIVSPVVEGSVLARQERRNDKEGVTVLPIQIHGDSAFAGQGVVMETFQMSQSRGYSTKGTIHIVVNNQIGFTTSNINDVRSSQYCTEVAKMVSAPIFHVNGDDPEAVIFVAQLALEYRMKFKKDVVIDMICYRRHGHNEADEPSATQPIMYQAIKALPTTRDLYAQKLFGENVMSLPEEQSLTSDYRNKLDAGHCVAPHVTDEEIDYPYAFHWKNYAHQTLDQPADTAVPLEVLRELSAKIEQLPAEFKLHPRVAKIMDGRHKMAAGALPIDWGYGETLAYATLLNEGYRIRLSGQDSGRGTFFHRHAVWHNQLHKEAYIPLKSVAKDSSDFHVIDSLLSEEAVLAFEYGYSSTNPETLVIWEAQFGDFANNAQVVIDQFISAGEQKWQRLCGLVMLLPHGYEGQGPEHSSARLERYLQLCAEDNMQVCVPSTPSQVFHMLRRQMKRNCRKPLICLSPKSLLRHKLAVSTLEDLTDGQFNHIIGEVDDIDPANVTRVVLCSGKVYYDLLERRRAEELDTVVIIRIEQLYPFPEAELKQLLSTVYVKYTDLVWCQEEPRNQGAWYTIKHNLDAVLKPFRNLIYAGREASASPAVGLASIHIQQQQSLVMQALYLTPQPNTQDEQ